MEKHPLHLKNPELQKSEEVERAVERNEDRTGEKTPNDPAERIETYTNRLENIFLNTDERVRTRNVEMLRDKIYDALIIKKEDFPENYFGLQRRVAREQGHGEVEITEETRENMMETAIEDQRHSLDAWIDYLSSDDAVYPPWFKYYVWTQIIKLSQFDKERGAFKKRTRGTVATYPDIYREPLAKIADLYEEVKKSNTHLKEPEIKEAFSKKFPTLYAELIQESLSATMEGKEEIRGEWIKYKQGTDGEAEKLFQSLDGKGTGWCTAGRSTAETQVQSGDFYVYYTNDSSGMPNQPRLAIRMNGQSQIGEIRGTLPHQNIEPIMQKTLDKKLQEFGTEADAYHKKNGDMKTLTILEKKRERDEEFTKDDLRFLYEIDSTIEGFGYQRDPRIEELHASRNRKEDIVTMCDCPTEYITHTFTELNANTQVYCEDTGKKIAIADFREQENAQKLSQLIELAKQFKEVCTPATPDLSFEGGIVSLTLSPEVMKSLETYESAIEAYKSADSTPTYIYEELKNIPWHPPESSNLDVLVLNHGQTTSEERDMLVTNMDTAGYRPLTFAELTALGIIRPDLNKRNEVLNTYDIHVLGGSRLAPCLGWGGDERGLGARGVGSDWNGGDRFLFVRK